jgi:N-acyl-D-amino-acid deacylase
MARAPMQAGDITTTALAAHALKEYAAPQDRLVTDRRLAAAKAWLVASTPRTTDDKVYRLLGLRWLAAADEHRVGAASQLLADQRPDGGWAQQDNMPTDPYATGLALVAMNEAGGLSVTDRSYQRGVAYLLQRQWPDGSWFVKTRSIPTNPYFESGFPYGKSQFISYAGSCWATMALLLTMPKAAGEGSF